MRLLYRSCCQCVSWSDRFHLHPRFRARLRCASIVAAALAYPDGSMKAGGLRAKAAALWSFVIETDGGEGLHDPASDFEKYEGAMPRQSKGLWPPTMASQNQKNATLMGGSSAARPWVIRDGRDRFRTEVRLGDDARALKSNSAVIASKYKSAVTAGRIPIKNPRPRETVF